MSNKDKTEHDFLGSYMNSGKREKAPDGFTGKLMARVEAEAPVVKESYRLSGTWRIPAIAASIAAGLVIFSALAGNTESSIFIALGEKLKFLTIYLPEPDKIILPEFYLPQIFVYISVGLLVLWLLDLSLNHIFNRGRG